jgi:hypothetical protein
MYTVRNIVNRKESDVICHSVRRSRAPTRLEVVHYSLEYIENGQKLPYIYIYIYIYILFEGYLPIFTTFF